MKVERTEKPALVRGLLSPEAYPERPQEVELVQTQISFVFLAGPYVYKVKKPVNFGFLDFTTLEKRHFFCQQEVLLNRRLCPDTYLGVVKVVQQGGCIRVEGEGEVLDYAVKMRLLPRELMLDYLLEKGEATPGMLDRIAQRLAAFHRQAETSPDIARYGSLEAIRFNLEENFSQTEPYVGLTLPAIYYQAISRATRRFLDEEKSRFLSRQDGGRIRDCHGDLHAAHICLADGLCIFDCIEFNDRFRYCDVASEIAFLAMDLDHHSRPDLSRRFVEAYVQASGDRGLSELLDFYKGYRAYVRGKVEGFKLQDPHVPPQEKAQAQGTARRYFDLAYAYTRRGKLSLFITAGLVGTGKSGLAEGLARARGLAHISSDLTRKALAGIAPTEHRFDDFDTGLYSPDITRGTYDEVFQRARQELTQGRSVVLDASFKGSAQRRRALELARETGAELWVLECTAPEATVRERLERRLRKGTSPSDGRWEIYLQQKKEFDPVAEVDPSRHLVVDTSGPKDEVSLNVLERLAEKENEC